MMNTEPTQPIQTIEPQLPMPNLPEISIDPTNPLAYVIVLTFFLGSTSKTTDAITGLTQAITALWLAISKKRRSVSQKDDSKLSEITKTPRSTPKQDDTSCSSKHDSVGPVEDDER